MSHRAVSPSLLHPLSALITELLCFCAEVSAKHQLLPKSGIFLALGCQQRVKNTLFWSCRNDSGIDCVGCFFKAAAMKNGHNMRSFNSFFYLLTSVKFLVEVFLCNFIAFYFVQDFSPIGLTTLDVLPSSVVRHRCCLLPLACRASLPLSSTCYYNPGVISCVKSIKRESEKRCLPS